MNKIDVKTLLEMIGEGKEQKEIAQFFGVSPAAVCKRLKRLTAPQPEPLKVDSLTPKERAFCLEVASGKSQTQSALTAYDVSSRDSAKALGHTLMKNGDIMEAITELMEMEGLGKRYRVKKLKSHVENADPVVSLRALDMSFKLADDFPAKKNVNINANLDFLPFDLERYR